MPSKVLPELVLPPTTRVPTSSSISIEIDRFNDECPSSEISAGDLLVSRAQRSKVLLSAITGDVQSLSDELKSFLSNDEYELGQVVTQQHAAAYTRPPEPELNSRMVAVREFESMISAGRDRAEFDKIGAGFLGGAKPAMIGLWTSLAALMLFAFMNQVQSTEPSRYSGPDDESYTHHLGRGGTHIFQISGFMIATLRAYFLAKKKWRRAYWAIIVFAIPMTISGYMYLVAIMLAYTSKPERIQTFCGEPDTCSSSQVLFAQLFDWAGVILLFASCSCVPILANGLAEEKRSECAEVTRAGFSLMAAGLLMTFVEAVILGNPSFAGSFFVAFLSVLGITAYLHWRHRKSKLDADRIVAADCKLYDLEWSKLVESREECKILEVLKGVVEGCTASSPEGFTKQARERLRLASEASSTTKPRQYISDLPVLFAQAATINPHFQACVKYWAGGVPGARPKSISIKRRDRAIEKTFRSYAGDASWLIDLARSAIIFETTGALIETLKRINNDARVSILQIKNRLDINYDSRESAGYRNVSLSLIIVDETTMGYGVDGHICELQLCLSIVENIKKAEGHSRYVKWRDMLAL